MVEVSLYELVQVKQSARSWPHEFRSLVEKCEADVADRLPFGVVADWCDERDEPELAEAFRWLHKRPDVGVVRSQAAGRFYYFLEHYPNPVGYVCGETDHGLIGLVVKLAERLAEMREAMA